MLADSYGRIATDLRVSLTDRCNLRCDYCMPAEGLDWLPRPALLTDDEVARLVRVGVERLGITEVRFTGGEPLLRRGLPGIVARTAQLRPRPEISVTTNGIGLDRLAGPLAEWVFEPLMAPGGGLAANLGGLVGTGTGRGLALMFILMGLIKAAAAAGGALYRPLRTVEDELTDQTG